MEQTQNEQLQETNWNSVIGQEQMTQNLENALKYKKISQFPSIKRDVALLLKDSISCEEVIRTIKNEWRC